MPSERKEKSTTPLARDDFSNNEFNTIINTGLHQAKNNESQNRHFDLIELCLQFFQ